MAQEQTQSASKRARSPVDLSPQLQSCLSTSAQHHQVNYWILAAILSVESDFNPLAINRNSNQTVDVGMGQHNSMHFGELAKHGIAPSDLFNPCVSIYVAGWHLSKAISRNGGTWYGIATYHSATPCYNRRYQALLWNKLLSWGVVKGSKLTVPNMSECRGLPNNQVRSAFRVNTATSNTGLHFYDFE